MEIQPRLKTIEMVRNMIKRHSRQYSIYPLWKKLPKKMMYQTYKVIINHLLKSNEILIDENKKICWIFHPIIKMEPINKKKIIYNLSYYGYDLISYEKIGKHGIMQIVDLIIEILIRYPEARFIEAIPILVIKNRINYFELYRKAYDFGLINKIGFLLENAFIIAKKTKRDISYLKNLLEELKKEKEKRTQYFSIFQDKMFLEKTTPSLMKKWNLEGNFSTSDFFKEAYL